MEDNDLNTFSQEIKRLKEGFLKLTPQKNNYRLPSFEEIVKLKLRFDHLLDVHPEAYILDLIHAVSLTSIVLSKINTEPYEIMKIIRNSGIKMADDEYGGFRDIYELVYKISKEIISICNRSLERNINRVIQPGDSVETIEEKMKDNYEINYFYSMLRLHKGVVLCKMIVYFQDRYLDRREGWYKEAFSELITAQRGFVYATKEDLDRVDYYAYMKAYDMSKWLLKKLKNINEFNALYNQLQQKHDIN